MEQTFEDVQELSKQAKEIITTGINSLREKNYQKAKEEFTAAQNLLKNSGLSGYISICLSLTGMCGYLLDKNSYKDSLTLINDGGYMAEYSKQITPLVYHSFFSNTLDLSKLPEYQAVTIPMLAICGSKEVRDMKTSLTLLAQNPNCQTMTLQGANHDFPMRNAKQLNPMLEKFILECL